MSRAPGQREYTATLSADELNQHFSRIIEEGLTFEIYLTYGPYTSTERAVFQAIHHKNPTPLTITEFVDAHLSNTSSNKAELLLLAQAYDDQVAAIENHREKRRKLKALLKNQKTNSRLKRLFHSELRALNGYLAAYPGVKSYYEQHKAAFYQIDPAHQPANIFVSAWSHLSQILDSTFLSGQTKNSRLKRERAINAHTFMLQHLKHSNMNIEHKPALIALELYHNLLVYKIKHKSKSRFNQWLAKHQFNAANILLKTTHDYLNGKNTIRDLGRVIADCQEKTKPSLLQRIFGKSNYIYRVTSILSTKINTRPKPLELIREGFFTRLATQGSTSECDESFHYLCEVLQEDLTKKMSPRVFEKYYDALKSSDFFKTKNFNLLRRIPGYALLTTTIGREALNNNALKFKMLAFVEFTPEDITKIKDYLPTLKQFHDSDLIHHIARLVASKDYNTDSYESALTSLIKYYIIRSCIDRKHKEAHEILTQLFVTYNVSANRHLESNKLSLHDLLNGDGRTLLQPGKALPVATLSFIEEQPQLHEDLTTDDITKLTKSGLLAHWYSKHHHDSYKQALIRLAKETKLSPEQFLEVIDQDADATNHIRIELINIYWESRVQQCETIEALLLTMADIYTQGLAQPVSLDSAIGKKVSEYITKSLSPLLSSASLQLDSQEILALGVFIGTLEKMDTNARLQAPLDEAATHVIENLRTTYLTYLLTTNNWQKISLGFSERLTSTERLYHDALKINWYTVASFIKDNLTELLKAESISFATLHQRLDLFHGTYKLVFEPLRQHMSGLVDGDSITEQGLKIVAQFLDANELILLKKLGGIDLLKSHTHLQLNTGNTEPLFSVLIHAINIENADTQKESLALILNTFDMASLVDAALAHNKPDLIKNLLESMGQSKAVRELKNVITKKVLEHLTNKANKAPVAYIKATLRHLRRQVFPAASDAHDRKVDKIITQTLQKKDNPTQLTLNLEYEFSHFTDLLTLYLEDDGDEAADPYQSLKDVNEFMASDIWKSIKIVSPHKASEREKTVLPVIEKIFKDTQATGEIDRQLAAITELYKNLNALEYGQIKLVIERHQPNLMTDIKHRIASLEKSVALNEVISARHAQLNTGITPSVSTDNTKQLCDTFETGIHDYIVPLNATQTQSKFFDAMLEIINKHPDDALFIRFRNILEKATGLSPEMRSRAASHGSKTPRSPRSSPSSALFTQADLHHELVGEVRDLLLHFERDIIGYEQFTIKDSSVGSRFDLPNSQKFIGYETEASSTIVVPCFEMAIKLRDELRDRSLALAVGAIGKTEALSITKLVKFKEAINLVRNIHIISAKLQQKTISISEALQTIITILVLHKAYIPSSTKQGYATLIHHATNQIIEFAAEKHISLGLSPDAFARIIQPILDRTTPSQLEQSRDLRCPVMTLEQAKNKLKEMFMPKPTSESNVTATGFFASSRKEDRMAEEGTPPQPIPVGTR